MSLIHINELGLACPFLHEFSFLCKNIQTNKQLKLENINALRTYSEIYHEAVKYFKNLLMLVQHYIRMIQKFMFYNSCVVNRF